MGLVLAGRDAVTSFFALAASIFSEVRRSAVPLARLTIPATAKHCSSP
jgi:hypothetical protein